MSSDVATVHSFSLYFGTPCMNNKWQCIHLTFDGYLVIPLFFPFFAFRQVIYFSFLFYCRAARHWQGGLTAWVGHTGVCA